MLIKVYCPTCRTWICMVGDETVGRIAPYCKKCKENKIIELVPKVPHREK